jgi:hypothetical protein
MQEGSIIRLAIARADFFRRNQSYIACREILGKENMKTDVGEFTHLS